MKELTFTDEEAGILSEILFDWYSLIDSRKDRHGNYTNGTWSDCLELIDETLPLLRVEE